MTTWRWMAISAPDYLQRKSNDVSIKIGNTSTTESTKEQTLRTTKEINFHFKTHIKPFWKKAAQAVLYLLYTWYWKFKQIMWALSSPYSATAPWCGYSVTDILIWYKIKHNYKTLRIVYKGAISDYDDLLTRDNSGLVQKQNLQLLNDTWIRICESTKWDQTSQKNTKGINGNRDFSEGWSRRIKKDIHE